MTVPAPDAIRCNATHPDDPMARCFRVRGHDSHARPDSSTPTPHLHERAGARPDTYHASWVRQWWDSNTPRPASLSPFPDGAYDEDADPNIQRHLAGIIE